MHPASDPDGPSYQSVFDVIRLALTDKDKKKTGKPVKADEKSEDDVSDEEMRW